MKLKQFDYAALTPYLPIKNAYRDLVAMALVLLVSIPAIGWLGTVFLAYGRIDACITACGTVGLMIWLHTGIMLDKTPECKGSLRAWARHFVDRNFYGYELWCVRNLYGDPTVSYEIRRRDVLAPSPWPRKMLTISIPLNVGARCGVVIPDHLSHWSIYVHRLSSESFNAGPIVRMQNQKGDCFMIGVERALRILISERSTYESDKLTEYAASAGWLIEGLMSRLDAARGNLLTERLERDKAVGDIEETVAEIDATKRFVRSKEGAAVRARLAGKLASHLEFRDIPRRKRENAA